MRLGIVVFLVGLSACAPGLSGQLVATQGNLAITRDAKVNVTRLDVTSGEDSQPSVFIGDVSSDGSFAVTLDAADGEYLVEAVVPGYMVASQKLQLSESNSVILQIVPIGKPTAGMIGTNMNAETGIGSGGATLTPPKL